MAGAFRQVWADFGVDESRSGVTRMIVPLKKGGGIVALVGVEPKIQPVIDPKKAKRITLTEFTIEKMSAMIGQMPRTPPVAPAALGNGVRYFFVTAREKSGGSDGVLVTCGGASLRVNTMETRNFKIAIRHVEGKGKNGNHSRLDADFDALVDGMNAIWVPQANIGFTLVKSVRAKMDKAKLAQALGKDHDGGELPEMVEITRYHRAFLRELVGDAAFTLFLLNKTSDKNSETTTFTGDRYRVLGVTSSDHKYALISDDRSPSTMAHEAGHLLGQKHMGTDQTLLMREGGAGTTISYDLALSINGKY